MVVRAQSRLLLVDQSEICFASIESGTISVVTRTVEGHSNCRTLEELSDQLNPETFWRAHRSFLVNIQHIREVVPWFKSSYQLRMDDPKKTEIPVSRAQTKRLCCLPRSADLPRGWWPSGRRGTGRRRG